RERADLLLRIADLREHFGGVLAEQGACAIDPRGRRGEPHRRPDLLHLPELGMRRLGEESARVQVGIVEHLIVRLEEAARNAGRLALLDPRGGPTARGGVRAERAEGATGLRAEAV